MTKRDWIVISIWIVIVCVILSLMCASVFAHVPTWEEAYPGDPNPFNLIDHFCPNTSDDPCWGDIYCKDGMKQYDGGHGHIYEDGSWGYWAKGAVKGDDVCSVDDTPPVVLPVRRPTPERIDAMVETIGRDSIDLEVAESTGLDEDGQPDRQTDYVRPRYTLIPPEPDKRLQILLDYLAMQDTTAFDRECENDHTVEVAFDNGFTFHTLPVVLDGVNTVADLWDYYDFLKAYDDTMSLLIDGLWWRYDGDRVGNRVGEIWLNPHMAISVNYDGEPVVKELIGCRILNAPIIRIGLGANFVGFPQVPDGYVVPSDFLNDLVTQVWVAHEGDWKWIENVGDDGDTPLVNGQGIGLESSSVFDLLLTVPAAPMAERKRVLTTSWATIKRRR